VKVITNMHDQVHVTLTTFSRLPGQRSRSCSDSHRNLVNLIAPAPVKGFQSKHAQILCKFRPETC